MAVQVRRRHRRVLWIIKTSIKKAPVPQWEQGQKINSAVPPCLPVSRPLSTVPTHRPPLTQAIRQRILWLPISPCPRRPICCSAFRSDLSLRNSLWMRWQFYFRVVGLSLINTLNYKTVRLSRTFFRHRRNGLPKRPVHGRIRKTERMMKNGTRNESGGTFSAGI